MIRTIPREMREFFGIVKQKIDAVLIVLTYQCVN
jgi:hypothetical protein